METRAWVAIKSKNGKVGRALSGGFVLPEKVAEPIRQGKELGEADDIVFGRVNSKQDIGAVGILTGGSCHKNRLLQQGGCPCPDTL